MEIRYKKWYIYFSLFAGVTWGVLAIDYLVMIGDRPWLGISYAILSLAFLSKLYFDYTNKYVKIDNQRIRISNFPMKTKELLVSNLTSVKKFGENFIFKAGGNQKITVNKSMIHHEDLIAFMKIYDEIESIINEKSSQAN